jgi:hypothetical protein
MIGMIALGGIIVRQSILIVEFVKIEVAQGREVAEAAVRGAELRMRPIFITSLTLMAGAFAIITDPIFNGMAISLMYGAGVATVMALLIIPLGCISARKQFYIETADDGKVVINPAFERIEKVSLSKETAGQAGGTPFLMKVWGGLISGFTWVFYIIRAIFTMIMMGVKSVFGMFRKGGGTPPPPRETPPGGTPPPPRGGGTPPPPREPLPGTGTPPPPREEPATATAGTPPPPREPLPATDTPPPVREEPATATAGTPPPPREPLPATDTPPPVREEPATATAGTPPPPREVMTDTAASAPVATETAVAEQETTSTTADETAAPPPRTAAAIADALDADIESEEGLEAEASEIIGRKRRGIRLKQDLT